MKTKIILLCICICFSSSCKNTNPPETIIPGTIPYHIEIEKYITNSKSCELNKIGSELEYIVLEDTPNSLLGTIVHTALCDSFIFVHDIKKVLQFDRHGKFIRQIGTIGRGPGEYSSVNDFCIDNKNIYILPFDGKEVKVYDFKGQFIRSIQSPHPQVSQIVLKDTGSLIFHSPINPGRSHNLEFNWFVTDKQGNVLTKIRNYLDRSNERGLTTLFGPMYLFNHEVRFKEYGIDTLYYFKNSKKEPYAIFNQGKLKMDPDPDFPGITFIEHRERVKDKVWIDNFMVEDADYLFFTVQWGFSKAAYCTYNKQTSEVTILKDDGFKNNLDGGPKFFPQYIYNDSILVDWIDPIKLLEIVNSDKSQEVTTDKSGVFKKLKDQLTETSNPVMMVLKQ